MVTRVLATWNELRRRDAKLASAGLYAMQFAVVGVLLMLNDPRTLSGENVWIKPIKFSLAFGTWLMTIAWLLGELPHRHSMKRWISRGIVLGLFLEGPPLLIQAARGVPSHFNVSTKLDFMLYSLMGAGVMIQTILMIALTVMFFDRRIQLDRTYLLALRAGLLLFLLGLTPGFAMVFLGSHSNGGIDRGAGLSSVDWSEMAGDLRIAHFIGLHALQVLPIAGAIVSRGCSKSIGGQIIVGCFSAIYLVVFVMTFVNALHG